MALFRQVAVVVQIGEVRAQLSKELVSDGVGLVNALQVGYPLPHVRTRYVRYWEVTAQELSE